MSIGNVVKVADNIVVCYRNIGSEGGCPPVIAHVLQSDAVDGFTPTIEGKSITHIWAYAYSGALDRAISEYVEVHHNHPSDKECLESAHVALQSGAFGRVSELLSRLGGCRDTMSLFRDSARLKYPLKSVTPSPSGGLPQITENRTLDLRDFLDRQILKDEHTIRLVQSLFSDSYINFYCKPVVVIQRSDNRLKDLAEGIVSSLPVKKALKASSAEFKSSSLPPEDRELPEKVASSVEEIVPYLPVKKALKASSAEFKSSSLPPEDRALPAQVEKKSSALGGVSLLGILYEAMGISEEHSGPAVFQSINAFQEGAKEGVYESLPLKAPEEKIIQNGLGRYKSYQDLTLLSTRLVDRKILPALLRRGSF